MEVEPIELVDSPTCRRCCQVFGCRRRADGTWALRSWPPSSPLPTPPCTSDRSSCLETAALDLAVKAAGTGRLQGISSHVMFMARGKTGPFRVEGEAMAGTDGMIAVRTTLFDEGAADKAVTVGSYLFTRA